MFKTKKFSGKSKGIAKLHQKIHVEFEEDFYEDDFEEFDYGTGIDTNEILVTPSASAVSITPETDSAGNSLNQKGSPFAEYDFMHSLESEEYTYEDEEEEEGSQSQNYDFHLFREVLEEIPISKQKKYKNGTRSSLTFSNQRVQEIERDNKSLLKKIMKSGPSREVEVLKAGGSANQRPTIKSAAEVNRRKKQHQINYENYMLKRKLDKIAARRTSLA